MDRIDKNINGADSPDDELIFLIESEPVPYADKFDLLGKNLDDPELVRYVYEIFPALLDGFNCDNLEF